jgi:3-oxoadipate enol-lactonase
MPIAEINGTRINYELSGDEDLPLVVFSNSLGTNLTVWDEQVGALGGFRALRYDTRGHGQSAVMAGDYSIEMLGRDVLALLDFLDIDRAAFCGLSLGGFIGQWLGAHAPQRFSKLVLANTAAKLGTEQGWNQRIQEVRSGGIAAIADGVLSRWFTEPFRRVHPDRVAWVKEMLLSTPADGYASCCAAVRDMDLRADTERITVPTLVIAGSADPVASVADAEFLREHIDGVRMTLLPAAHLSSVEARDAFNQALLAFLC